MLELTELLVIVGFTAICSFFFSVAIALALRWFMDRQLLARIASCEFSLKNAKSQDVKLEKKQKLNLALLRIKELYDQKTPELEIAKTIAMEYPDVAWDAIREAKKLAEQFQITSEE